NDSDVMQFSRDTYSYLGPRDGAMVADAMDSAGFPDVSRSFFSLCAKLLTEGGYFLHKYNPDGSPASSWHPWVAAGRPQLPIQEDETALVLWALWRHYLRYRDIEFVRPLWIRLVRPAGDFLARYRDPETGLPLPSYDLWEERWGIHAFTLASTWAGLRAAWQFAVCFGDVRRASRYARAAGEVQAAFLKYLWSEEHGRFLRRIVPRDQDRVAALTAEVLAGRDPIRQSDAFDIALPGNPATNGHTRAKKKKKAAFELDSAVDSSLYGIFAFGLLPVDDERVASTMEAVAERLWVRTDVGGIARYENDHYHRMVGDTERVPGNPWFICTLWLAEYYIARAKSEAELDEALPLLQWVVEHALPSGVLAEQVHPETNAPLSVSPLTWSHATVVSTVMAWLSRRDEMRSCPRCGQAGAGALPDARLLRRDSLNRPSPLESRA
ncbi:MAG: glycoside hydrolase family 15 protein, partial [Phycisphaeraceae bacterium]